MRVLAAVSRWSRSALERRESSRRRSSRLLQENLSAAQRLDYEAHGYFYVIGGKTGSRYRIRHGRLLNVEQLGPKGQRVARLCFFPKGDLPAGDVLLAQKLALELFETETLTVAYRMPYY